MVCTNRQLAQSQREDAFASTRAGVVKAIRPFSGSATPDALADYLNREVFPVLQQARSKLNDVYLQVADNAPSANPLTYIFSDASAADASWVFDGVNDFVDHGVVTPLRPGPTDTFTASIWYKGTSVNGALISQQDAAPVSRGWSMFVLGGKAYAGIISDATGADIGIQGVGNTTINDGLLHNIILTVDGSTDLAGFNVYVDTVLQTLSSTTDNLTAIQPTAATTATLQIGARNSAEFAAGVIAHASFFDRVLNAAERTQLYNAGVPPDVTTTSMWAANGKFGIRLDGSDTSGAGGVIDYGPSAFNGTAQGGLGLTGTGVTTATARAGLDGVPQNTSTLLRLSQTNSRLIDVASWLGVMKGSATTPIGVVTVVHAVNPSRFIRFDLNTVTDRGAYWDLDVSVIESSHTNPFVEGDPIQVSFIAGVASGAGAVPKGIQAIAAGTQTATSGTVLWSNSNGLSFGMSGSSRVTGSFSTLVFSNSNNVSFGIAGSTLTASATIPLQTGLSAILLTTFGSTASITAATDTLLSSGTVNLIRLTDDSISKNNVEWKFSGNTLMAAAKMTIRANAGAAAVAQEVSFSNANNVSWGVSSTTVAALGRIALITASVTVASTQASVNLSAGTTSSLAASFVFSNSNNVSFGINGATLTASATVAATRELGIVSHIGGNVVSSVSQLAFSNASNVTFSLSTAAGAATLIASVAAGGGGGITAFNLSNAASSVAATGLTFSNANGFSFLLSTAAGNAATLSGSYSTHALAVSAAGASASAGTVVWSNSNNVTFGQAGSTITASVTVASTQASIRISAGTGTANVSGLSFADNNGINWILTNNGSTISASYVQVLGLVSHVGGNQVAGVSRLVFSNANNVTWSLSTAASAATVLASVAAAGGGGIAMIQGTDLISSGTASFTPSQDTTLALPGNVSWNITGQTVQAAAAIVFSNPGGNASRASRLDFVNSDGMSWGLASTSNASGRVVQVTASAFNPPLSHWNNWIHDDDILTTIPASIGASSFYICPMAKFGDPFPGPMTIGTLDIFLAGGNFSSTQSTQAHGMTYRGGLYTLANSTLLSLLNSFSMAITGTTQSFSDRQNNFAGVRWATVHSSLWSAQPVLSQGIQYWYGFCMTTSGTAVISAWMGQNERLINSFRGFFNIAQSTNQSSGFAPFFGVVSSGVPPANISSFQLLNNIATSGRMPMIQFRTNVTLC